jgi:hypothetical protein
MIYVEKENGEPGWVVLEEDTDLSPGSILSFMIEFFTGRKDARPRNKRRVNYHEYIQSREWKEKAKLVKARAHMRCEYCGMKGNGYTLQAHHLTYERLGREKMSDLVCLCDDCHKEAHV